MKSESQLKALIAIISFAIIALVPRAALAQDVAPYGEQLKSWVDNEAHNESVRICNNDYADRIQKTLILSYDNAYRDIKKCDSLLSVIYTHIKQVEDGLKGKDSVTIIVKRSEAARLDNLLLLSIEGSITELMTTFRWADSISGKQFFTYYGLNHVGRESVMESYTELGNSLAKTFNIKYNNDFYVSVSSDGTTTIQGQGNEIVMYSTTGAAIGYEIGGPWVSAAGAVIGAAIGWFSNHHKQQQMKDEIDRQNGILQEAIMLLPQKLLKGEEMFAIYKSCYDTIAPQFKPLRDETKVTTESLFKSWKSLYLYNTERMEWASLELTNEKIKAIQTAFGGDSVLKILFNEDLQQTVITDIGTEEKKLSDQKSKLLKAANYNNRLILDFESYADELIFFNSILTNLANNNQLIPDRPFIKQQGDFIDSEISFLPKLKSLILKKPFLNVWTMSSANVPFKMAMFKEPIRVNVKLSVPLPDGNGFSICAEGGGYMYCFGGDTYRNRFDNNGNNPVQNVFGSSNDGGVRGFNASAARQIGRFRQDLQTRNQRLNSDYNSMHDVLNKLIPAIKPSFDEINSSLNHSVTDVNSELAKFYSDNSGELELKKEKLDGFAAADYGDYSAQHLLNDLDLSTAIQNSVPSDHLSTTKISIAGKEYTSTKWTSTDPEMQSFINEQSKQDAALKAIDQRISGNLTAGRKDPVFNTREDFSGFKSKMAVTDEFINSLTMGNSDLYADRKFEKELIKFYNDQNKIARLYGSSELPKNTTIFKNYPYLGPAQRQDLSGVVETYKNCVGENCNINIATAIFGINHDKWFTEHRRNDGTFDSPGDMLKDVNNSSEWHFVGYANGQKSINQASVIASKGGTVLAFHTDGQNTEVAIVKPGLPYRNGIGKWQKLNEPEVIRFSPSNPQISKANAQLSDMGIDPGAIMLYAKNRNAPYANMKVTSVVRQSIVNSVSRDPAIGSYEVPSINLTVTYTDDEGNVQKKDCQIDINGDYVNRVRRDFGNHSEKVFQQIYDNRDDLFQKPGTVPGNLTASQANALKHIEICISNIDSKFDAHTNPECLYYSESVHELYNTCVNELIANQDPGYRDVVVNSAESTAGVFNTVVMQSINIATAVTPGINDVRDWYELTTGTDMISGEKLQTWEKVVTGVAVIAGSGVLFRNIIHTVANKEVRAVLTESLKGVPGLKYIKDGELARNFISDEGLIYQNWNLTSGLSELERESRIKHILRRHTEWYRDLGREIKLEEGESRAAAEVGTRFRVDEPDQVFRTIDEAWKLRKEGKFVVNERGYREYVVDLKRELAADKKNVTAVKIITANRDDGHFIITAYPVKPK